MARLYLPPFAFAVPITLLFTVAVTMLSVFASPVIFALLVVITEIVGLVLVIITGFSVVGRSVVGMIFGFAVLIYKSILDKSSYGLYFVPK
ncbi:hypothetical protein ERX35_010295 [Macrococcus equipercicus]|uniref:Uncharacterized protein n=1 Tax=Macrococcus equipercicus TaxID=69967 RepID=A0ABQ6R6L5_9STAP|nr:hypothetical protein [Macrococcus equipercicus]KAA1036911.1 hypothetical protein ERX35_010295 [Macrococcus equipercicus]